MVINMDGWLVFYITIIMAAIGAAFIFVWNELRYKHTVKIREITSNGRSFIIEDKAKEFTDGKNSYWRLKKEKDKIKKNMPVPPSDSMDITKRGKKFVEVVRTPMGEYVFLSFDNLDDVKPMKPLSTNQRSELVNQIVKAESRKISDWKKDLPAYVMGGMGMLLIAFLLIFGPDIINTYTKGATQISDSLTEYERIRHQNLITEMEQWQKVTLGIQQIYNLELENKKSIDEITQEIG